MRERACNFYVRSHVSSQCMLDQRVSDFTVTETTHLLLQQQNDGAREQQHRESQGQQDGRPERKGRGQAKEAERGGVDWRSVWLCSVCVKKECDPVCLFLILFD